MKKCPYCAEEIVEEAKKCKHCGEFLDKSAGAQKGESATGSGYGTALAGFLLLAVGAFFWTIYAVGVSSIPKMDTSRVMVVIMFALLVPAVLGLALSYSARKTILRTGGSGAGLTTFTLALGSLFLVVATGASAMFGWMVSGGMDRSMEAMNRAVQDAAKAKDAQHK